MTVSTESLQVLRVVVPTITVYMVYIKLRCVSRYKATLFTDVFFVHGVWILGFIYISFVDSLATVTAIEWMLRISEFYFGWATYGTYGSAFGFVMLAKFVIHYIL